MNDSTATSGETATATRKPRPGDTVSVATKRPAHLHGRVGTVTSTGPFAHAVALGGEHGDERIMRTCDLSLAEPDEPDAGLRRHLDHLRRYVGQYADFRNSAGEDPGEVPAISILVALGEIERLRPDLLDGDEDAESGARA